MTVHKNAKSFGIALDKLAKELPAEVLVAATQKVALDLLSRVVLKSPVLTGRFRGAWGVTIDVQDYTFTGTPDKSGRVTLARGEATITSIQTLPEVVWISNSTPYANRLENGWSQQAPLGVASVSLAELEAAGVVRAL